MPATALRLETVQDEPFLRHLYASTRVEEMAWFPWTKEQKSAFMAMQYDLRQSQYRLNYPDADLLIVTSMGNSVGRIAVHRGDTAFHLIDVALLPEWRGQGIGSRLIAGLLAEAGSASKPVRLHVETSSRALNLYRRVGFAPVEIQGIRWLMEWKPD